MTSFLEKHGYPPIKLEIPKSVNEGWQKGRCPIEGYQRAVALEHGDLSRSILAHPLFLEAMDAASGLSVMDGKRAVNLFLILALFLEKVPSQDVVEFGCFRGGSLIFMGKVLERLYPDATVFGFDTFNGMPVTDQDIDFHREGDFSETSLADVQRSITAAGLNNVRLVAGCVEDTFPAGIPPNLRIGLAHIDLDIYPAIKHCQNSVWPLMASGGYLVYDDATTSTCLGATQAVEELVQERRLHCEQIFPHFVFRAPIS